MGPILQVTELMDRRVGKEAGNYLALNNSGAAKSRAVERRLTEMRKMVEGGG
jgi:hypothetical protein